MPLPVPYLVECLWPSVMPADVAALDRRLARHAHARVEHAGTTLVPEDDVVFVWFEADSESDVRALCLAASVPFDRVVVVSGLPRARPGPNERNEP